jgi:YgiT-type zinc finger domain-containing protein
MSAQALADGAPCPVCALGGTLHLEATSEADLVDGRTVVVHGVPTLVCDRCGAELFDEATTRLLESFHEHAAVDGAQTLVVHFDALRSRAG